MIIPKLNIEINDNATRYFIYRDSPDNLPNKLDYYTTITPNIVYTVNKDELIDNQIEIYDNKEIEQSDNVTIYLDNPITLSKPIISYSPITYTYNKAIMTKYKIMIENINKPVVLGYRMLAEDSNNNVSKLSDMQTIQISHSIDDIRSWLECKLDGNWIKLIDLNTSEENEIYDITSKEYADTNGIFVSKVHSFKDDLLGFNNKYIVSDNLVVIGIKNIWYKYNDHAHYRRIIPLRVGCTIGDNNNIYSDVFTQNEMYAPIDKLVILRKEYDDDSDISEDDENATIYEIIRAGGIYYDNTLKTLQFNEENIYNSISVVNSDNHFESINLIDRGILQNITYKYTFIYYDCTGEQSEKYTIVNEVGE